MTNWRANARCRVERTDPELFFPVSERGPGARQLAAAKSVCGRCPVRRECLADAIDAGLDTGVFGGLSETERRNLTRHGLPAPVVWLRPATGAVACVA
ncbi:transcription factor WhiB [Amycolatopsis antarctica]|uniref:Transcriptional regulator WhiB n=1 Tax=Amycolatopsis antarctica TaxID=1854586 RepID=A0A263D0T9_9PSEU|nr:WhiB family transcriptional regulator [Amycolatopsis antarctica]OZM72074.1 transcription factor WhiB [Amycolatopsis antarctica]